MFLAGNSSSTPEGCKSCLPSCLHQPLFASYHLLHVTTFTKWKSSSNPKADISVQMASISSKVNWTGTNIAMHTMAMMMTKSDEKTWIESPFLHRRQHVQC
ncbi:unnamed protein product [Musa acuminata subsp. burmannicoides]